MENLHPKHPHHWLIILVIAIIAMALLAFTAQRPDIVERIPGFGPSATPTPLVSKNIIVAEPYADGYIAEEFTISGRAKSYEQGVKVRLSDKLSGDIYGETAFMPKNVDSSGYGDFKGTIVIGHPDMKSGQSVILELFMLDASGHEIDKVTIPLTFSRSGSNIIQ